jgi:hypothetical protein
MTSDAKTIIAFLFKRSGKTELGFSEMYLTLSMGLNWFTPDGAKAFVNNALKHKLLLKKDNLVKPGFEINKINVPLGFYPSGKFFEEESEVPPVKEKKVLDEIVKEIAENTKIEKNKIVQKIKKLEQQKNIVPEVAALLVGKEYDIDLEEFHKKIEEEIS